MPRRGSRDEAAASPAHGSRNAGGSRLCGTCPERGRVDAFAAHEVAGCARGWHHGARNRASSARCRAFEVQRCSGRPIWPAGPDRGKPPGCRPDRPMLPGANRGFRIELVGGPLVDQRRIYSTRGIHCREGRAGPTDRFASEDGLGSMPWMGGPLRLGSRARTRLVRRIVSTIVESCHSGFRPTEKRNGWTRNENLQSSPSRWRL